MKKLPPLVVVGLGWAVLFVYAYPGLMTSDSFDHLREARTGIYSDPHPPMINLIWKVADYIVAGPLGMLILQSATLAAGLYLILRRAFEPRRAAWWSAGAMIFPPVMVTMAVIWKDCVMAGLLALGAAALLSPRRGVRLLGVLAMFGATAVRYNAFGATLPLIVLLFEWRPGLPWLRRYALATGVWLATTLGAFAANRAITDHEMHYWHSSLAIYDIVGTLAHVDRDLPDAELLELLAGTELVRPHDIHTHVRAVYNPRDFFPIVNDEHHALWALPITGLEPAPRAQRDAIERAWWRTITTYPGAYAVHRLVVMGEVLRGAGAIVKREPKYADAPLYYGLGTGWSTLQQSLSKWMRFLYRHTPLFTPWLYAVLSLILLPLALRHRDVLALLLSGLIMELSLVPLAHSNDYRYSHWMVVCTVLAVIILTARRARGAQP